MENIIEGVFVSIVTPFKNGEIDYYSLENNINKLNNTKITGYLALGGNAETPALTESERSELLKFISTHRADKTLLAGIYNESTTQTIKLTEEYRDLGADYIRLAPPHYFPKLVNDQLLLNYYQDVADNSALPIILYNAPVLAGGIKISTKLAETLSKHPKIKGIKDSSLTGLYTYINIRRSNPDFNILAGSVNFFFPALMAGASGGDMTAANYLPDACCELYENVQNGDLNSARELHGRLLSVNSFVSGNWGFCGVKTAMNFLGFSGGEPRKPNLLPDDEETKSIEAILKAEGFLRT